MSDKFNKIYEQSINDPEKFWGNASNDVFWFKKPTKILNKSNPPFYKWYEDGITNTCYNALDIHIDQGNGKRTALIYDSPITGNKSKFTYQELKSKVSKFAGALKDQGVNKGDRVIIYMPMIPEAVVAMLACGRIGAIHSVVFGGFAANELASRIDDSKAKIILSASCGYEPGRTIEYKPLLKKAIELAKHKVEKCIIYQRKDFKVDLENSDIFPIGQDNSYELDSSMASYNPYGQSSQSEGEITRLFQDAIILASFEDEINYSNYDLIVVFHAGIGQDFSLPFLDPTPQDIPSTYVDNDMIKENIEGGSIVINGYEIIHGADELVSQNG